MFLAQFANQGTGGPNLRRIEPGCRFIQDQHRRRGQQSVRQADALAIAFRQGADDLPMHVVEPAAFEDVANPFPPPPAVNALDAGPEAKILVDAHVRIERTVFGHVADAPPGLDRIPEDVDAADGRLS